VFEACGGPPRSEERRLHRLLVLRCPAPAIGRSTGGTGRARVAHAGVRSGERGDQARRHPCAAPTGACAVDHRNPRVHCVKMDPSRMRKIQPVGRVDRRVHDRGQDRRLLRAEKSPPPDRPVTGDARRPARARAIANARGCGGPGMVFSNGINDIIQQPSLGRSRRQILR